jgi:hypothetical protein
MRRRHVILVLLAFGLLTVLVACGGGEKSSEREIVLAPLSDMPESVQQAPTTVQEAYRFAVANPDLVNQFPCYCGCVNVGHMSNLDCYVREVQDDGTIIYDNHAFG